MGDEPTPVNLLQSLLDLGNLLISERFIIHLTLQTPFKFCKPGSTPLFFNTRSTKPAPTPSHVYSIHARNAAIIPDRKIPSNVPAPPIETIGTPRDPIFLRFRRSAPTSVPIVPLT